MGKGGSSTEAVRSLREGTGEGGSGAQALPRGHSRAESWAGAQSPRQTDPTCIVLNPLNGAGSNI